MSINTYISYYTVKNQAKFLAIQPDKLKLNILSQKPTNRFGKTVKVNNETYF